MFFLIPLINGLLSRRLHLPPLIRDLRVAQVSIVILTIGTLLFGLAPSIPIVAIALAIVAAACALPSGLRCVGMHLTPPERLGTVSTFIAWVVNASGLVTGPFYAQAYKVGLSMGVPGLPYLIVTAALGVCCAVLVLMPLPKDQLVGEERMNESRYRGDADSETEGC
jgi:MFS family permease